MIRSMTGMGVSTGAAGATRLTVEVRSVNHRFFNPVIKLPQALLRIEPEMREMLRQRVARGHVTLNVQLARESAASAAIDRESFAAYAEQLQELSRQYALGPVAPGDILRLPGVVGASAGEDENWEAEGVLALLREALDALDAMRDDEGGRMRDFLSGRLNVFEAGLTRIELRAPQRLREQHARLQNSVTELLGGIAADQQRVAQEIAILADKLDIAEEIGRLHSHVAAFRATVAETSTEPRGKRLGFIVQEMLREVNTIGSKGADTAILNEVLMLKEELERLREQSENIE